MHILKTIGNTPLVKLENLSKELKCEVFAKCEFFNPGGSIKDRIALFMVEDALKQNPKLNGFIEPTSGNTGIGLALVCAIKKIPLTIVMPKSMSLERRAVIEHFGANLILTPAKDGMHGAIKKAKEIAKEQNLFMLNQFENPSNPKAHYYTTAVEIEKALPFFDIFLTGIGTGGTISGVGKYFKDKGKNIQIVGVEPLESAVLSGKEKGAHEIEGIGAGFIPKILDISLLDDVIAVSSDEAINEAKQLAKEGFFAGISSGANIAALKKLAKKQNIKGKKIVTILQDGASRYLSTRLFQ